MYSTLLAAFLCLFLFEPIQSKLNVEVLYESLCPDSLRFVTRQLKPNWAELGPYIDINFVPFGKSFSENRGLNFVCQHGPHECVGNKIQSCALNEVSDPNKEVDYVNCFMTVYNKNRNKRDEFARVCAAQIGLDYNTISRCYNSSEGINLQLSAEKETDLFSPSFIPTIVFNGTFNQELQDQSMTDFRRVVCGLIKDTYPNACNSVKSKRQDYF